MNKFNKTTVVLIFLLIASNIVWGLQFSSQKTQLNNIKDELAGINQNKKILIFQKMFVEKVLKSNGSVDFNTRVELQNAVTNINDEQITKVWNAFLSAKTEIEGQTAVKELLSQLASRVY